MKHLCHVFRCFRVIEGDELMCRVHWLMVPAQHRRILKVGATYRACCNEEAQPEWKDKFDDACDLVYEKQERLAGAVIEREKQIGMFG